MSVQDFSVSIFWLLLCFSKVGDLGWEFKFMIILVSCIGVLSIHTSVFSCCFFSAAMYMYDRSRAHQPQSLFTSHSGSFNSDVIEEEDDEDYLNDSSSKTSLSRQKLNADEQGRRHLLLLVFFFIRRLPIRYWWPFQQFVHLCIFAWYSLAFLTGYIFSFIYQYLWFLFAQHSCAL